jgi:hypothetical protein
MVVRRYSEEDEAFPSPTYHPRGRSRPIHAKEVGGWVSMVQIAEGHTDRILATPDAYVRARIS